MKHFPALSITLVSIALVPLFCFGCMEIGTPHLEEITHGYYTAGAIDHTSICQQRKGLFSPCDYLIYSVQDLDWNEKFIVVKSTAYPKRDSGDNTGILVWYVVDAINNQIYGPFPYDEYIHERQKLSVPDMIERLKPEETEFEAYQRKHSQSSKDKSTSWVSYMPCIGGALAIILLSVALRIWTENRKQSL